jgi:RNase P/RNase MRP subunit p29
LRRPFDCAQGDWRGVTGTIVEFTEKTLRIAPLTSNA